MPALVVRVTPRRFALPFVALLYLQGCCHPPRETVSVVVRGVGDDATRNAVETILPTMVDSEKGYMAMSSTSAGSQSINVRLSPVKGPAELARKIQFGDVQRVQGRTIYVNVDGPRARFQAFLIGAREAVQRLPHALRVYAFFLRIKAISWWTGRPQREVFWEQVEEVLRVRE